MRLPPEIKCIIFDYVKAEWMRQLKQEHKTKFAKVLTELRKATNHVNSGLRWCQNTDFNHPDVDWIYGIGVRWDRSEAWGRKRHWFLQRGGLNWDTQKRWAPKAARWVPYTPFEKPKSEIRGSRGKRIYNAWRDWILSRPRKTEHFIADASTGRS